MATPAPARTTRNDAWQLDHAERLLFQNATLENIYYSTSNISRDDAENSKTRAVIQKLGPLVSAIESYGKAVDTIAQIAPLYLLPIWGSIRVLLVVASAHGKFYNQIVDTLSRIGDILPRFRDYERIYHADKHPRLIQALSNSYLDIIVLCTKFRKLIRKQKTSTARRIFKPLSLNSEIDDAIRRFRQHKQNVEEEARTCQMIEAAEQRDAQIVHLAAERRRKLLDTLSSVEYHAKHRKLGKARHEGTGLWLSSSQDYKAWATASQTSVLCCYGIPGCGKSVLASSIVDLLIPTESLIFYYCDYADRRTLDASNCFGTLARQILERMDTIPEHLAKEIECLNQEGDRTIDQAAVFAILKQLIGLPSRPLYLILDGLDEALEPSQKVIFHGLKQLLDADSLNIKLFITGRDELESLLEIPSKTPLRRVAVSAAAITADIDNYVRCSTRRRIVEGSLVIRDSELEEEIVKALIDGAQGMFLWVEFQLHDLCKPESDYGIRLVLQNLPRSLSETYDRLLSRIEGAERREMIERMFKWIVCSRQPLHVNELSEGVAFTLCDQDWSPDKIPTNFHRLVRACGNLVVIDEDTSIVHLAHYTVQQYLLSHTESKFHFTLKEAHLMAGEFCVAYLNFTNFESHITLYTKNRNTDVAALEKLATNRSYGALIAQDNPGRRAIKVFHALRGSTDTGSVNINMARHLPYSKEKAPDLSAFYFLPYVVIHWLWHTTTIDMKHDTAEDAIDSRSLRILKFKNLVFDKKMLFKFRPWDELPEISADLRYIAMLGLGLMANHGYLIQSMFDRGLLLIDIFDEIKKWCLEQGVREKDVDSVRISRSIQACVESFSAESYVLQAPALEGLPVAWLYSRFIYACKKGHLDAILECAVLIPHELNIHLFIIAASSGHLPLVKFLLLSTAYGDKLDLREVTMACANLGGINLNACEHALLAGHSDVVTYLESEGHHFKRLFSDLHDPLLLDAMVKAIRHGRRDVVQIMLEHGVSPYATDSAGCNAFCEALRFKRRSIVDLLLTHGYSLNSTNYELPLTIAAATGDCRLVELLVYHGAAVFSYDYEHHGSANPVSVIMQDVEDDGWVIVQDDNDNGWGSFRIYLSPTPLYVACCHGHEDIVKLLVSHGAAVDLPSPAALAYLTLTKETPDAKLSAQLTVDSQEVPFVKPSRMSNWELPIVAAAARGHKDIVNFLLQSGSLPSDGRQRSAEFLMKNSVLQEIPSQAQVLIEREILASWANSTKLSPVQLEGFIYAGVDASDLTRDGKALFVWCLANEDFQTRDTILNSTSDRADFLHRSLVNFAKMCPTDMAITGQLISLGAVPYVRDELGIPEANQSLVSAALNGNAKLRIAFINSGVEFAIALAAKDPGYFTGRPARSLTQPNVSLKALVRLFEALNPGLKNSEYLLPFEKLCNILGCAGNHPEVAQKIFETLLFPSTQTLSLSYFVFLAIENNNLSLLKALHNNGINLNRWRKSDGTNPLMATASQNNSLALATFLLSLGADPHAKDAAGATALDRASAARNYRVAGLLYPYMYNSAS